MDNFDPYNVLLAIATNIPVLLMTAFVLQGPFPTRHKRVKTVYYVLSTAHLNFKVQTQSSKATYNVTL